MLKCASYFRQNKSVVFQLQCVQVIGGFPQVYLLPIKTKICTVQVLVLSLGSPGGKMIGVGPVLPVDGVDPRICNPELRIRMAN
jgi:hypothetical protein